MRVGLEIRKNPSKNRERSCGLWQGAVVLPKPA